MYSNISYVKGTSAQILIVIWMAIFTGDLFAASKSKLYVAEIDIPNRSLEARKVALRVGLVEIILRATGDESVLNISEIENMLESPEKYLQSYGYVDLNGDLTIKINFHEEQINSKLRSLDINPWVKRPEILLWMFVDGQSVEQLPHDSSQHIVNQVMQISSKIGLPIDLPLWDLEEEQAFDVSSNIQSQELIENLSKKYAKEVVLVSDVKQIIDGWRIVWTIYTQAETQHWVAKGDNLEFALQLGFKDVASLLRERFHLASNYGITKIMLSVRNITSSKDYQQFQKYLSKLSIVDSVNIISLKRKDVTFQIELTQDINKFKEILELNEQLRLVDSINYEHLVYKYKP